MGIGNKSKPVNLKKTNIFFFDNKYFFLSESGFWKEGVFEDILEKFDVDSIYVDNPYFTIIPLEIWNYTSENNKKEAAANNKKMHYIASKNSSIESFFYWGISTDLHKKLQNNCPQSTIRHFCESMIEISNKAKHLKIFHGEKTIYISAFSNGTLILVNRFTVESNDDSLYYFLSVIKEVNFIKKEFFIDYMGIEIKSLIEKINELLPKAKLSIHKQTDYKNN